MNHQVLDVRGIQGRAAKIRDIRAMAGRAMLDGPHDYRTEDLEGPLLDLAVSKAVGLKAVIHLVDDALRAWKRQQKAARRAQWRSTMIRFYLDTQEAVCQ